MFFLHIVYTVHGVVFNKCQILCHKVVMSEKLANARLKFTSD